MRKQTIQNSCIEKLQNISLISLILCMFESLSSLIQLGHINDMMKLLCRSIINDKTELLISMYISCRGWYLNTFVWPPIFALISNHYTMGCTLATDNVIPLHGRRLLTGYGQNWVKNYTANQKIRRFFPCSLLHKNNNMKIVFAQLDPLKLKMQV